MRVEAGAGEGGAAVVGDVLDGGAVDGTGSVGMLWGCPAVLAHAAPRTDTVASRVSSAHTVVDGANGDPLTVTLTSGRLSPGLTMARDGAITGTPTTAGTFTFTVRAATPAPVLPAPAVHTTSITIEPHCATPPPSTSPFVPGPGATGDTPHDHWPPTWVILAAVGSAVALVWRLLVRRSPRRVP